MKKISLSSLSKTHKIIMALSFLVILIIVSVVWMRASATGEPAAPTNFSLSSSQSSSSLTLVWTDNSSNEDRFTIHRQQHGGSWSVTTYDTFMTSPDVTSYVDSTAAATVSYDYRITACKTIVNDQGGCSEFVYLYGIYRGTPAAPSDLTMSANTNSSITIQWTDNATNENKFNVWRKLHSDTTWPGSALATIQTANTTSYYDSTVSTGYLYDYRVDACLTSYGCSDYSSTLSAVSTTVAPPTSFTYGTLTYNSVPLTWTNNAGSGVYFELVRKLSTANSFSSLTQTSTSNASYNDNSVSSGTTYDYGVRACLSTNSCSSYTTITGVSTPSYSGSGSSGGSTSGSGSGTSSGSSGGTGTGSSSGTGGSSGTGSGSSNESTTNSTPNAPSGLSLGNSSTSSGIYLIWTDNANNEDKFNIERKLHSVTTWDYTYITSVQIQQANLNSYTDTSVTAGTLYDYRVQACLSGYGCSAYTTLSGVSSSSTSNTQQNQEETTPVPASPSGLSLNSNPTATSISLKWIDNANNEDRFTVQRKLSSASWDNFTSSVTSFLVSQSNATTYTDTSVATGINYDYRVAACRIGYGCSGYSTLSGVSTSSVISGGGGMGNGITTEKNAAPITTTPQNIPSTTVPTTFTFIPNTSSIPGSTSTTSTVPTNTFVQPKDTSEKIQNLGLVVEQVKTAVDSTKEQLSKIISDSCSTIVKNAETSGQKIDTTKLYATRDNLLKKVDSSLLILTIITPEDINKLKTEVNKGLDSMKSSAGENVAPVINTKEITNTLSTLTETVSDNSKTLKNQGGDLLYKDTNGDGISDYNSIYVYNINPTTPSPVSTFEGKKINASEKILLGFDPTKSELVKITPEQPIESSVPVVSTYKVKEVALTDKNKVVLKGQALPNSFVTLYVYSTPIMVTVKTDSNGEWQYVMDKELENGKHTIYTATVNNTGNIVAKSSGYLFTKTAEAVTLENLPLAEASNIEKPGLLKGNNLYLLIGSIFAVFLIFFVLMGLISKKNKQ